MNFRKPSKVQERALPLLMNNPPKNLVGQSQSGTGKTAAFVLNVLSRLDLSTNEAQITPQALILAPTRELARQIVGVIQMMGQFLDGLIIGTAVPADGANRPSRMECSVVVGTPGTVMDMIKKRIMNARHLKVLVLDEADNMLDQQGLGDQCIRVKAYDYHPRDPHSGYHSQVSQNSSSYHSGGALLCYIPSPRLSICRQICPRGQRDHSAARRVDRGRHQTALYGLQ